MVLSITIRSIDHSLKHTKIFHHFEFKHLTTRMLRRLRTAVFRVAYTEDSELKLLPAFERFLVPILECGSVLYWSVFLLREKLYRCRVFKATRIQVPVVSVGNVSWGGNGKTPMVEYLAMQFLQCGIPPLILTRGYAGGDEAHLLASHLHGTQAMIGVGSNRVKTAFELIERYGLMHYHDILETSSKLCSKNKQSSPHQNSTNDHGVIGVIILDDGMQHWRIARDIEVVMVNALSLFGNQRLVPRGPLREPLSALSRADILVLHHANFVSPERQDAIKSKLESYIRRDTVVLFSEIVPQALIRIPNSLCLNSDDKRSLDVLKGANVVCISGIGCPESLSLLLAELGATNIDRMDFPDHHQFREKDILFIKEKVHAVKSKLGISPIIIVTEKDYFRDSVCFNNLQCGCDVFVLRSSLKITSESKDKVSFSEIILKNIRFWKDCRL